MNLVFEGKNMWFYYERMYRIYLTNTKKYKSNYIYSLSDVAKNNKLYFLL